MPGDADSLAPEEKSRIDAEAPAGLADGVNTNRGIAAVTIDGARAGKFADVDALTVK
jgi:hypothetical protein